MSGTIPPRVTVVLPTRSPHPGRLQRVFDALAVQSLPASAWELLLVDNGSSPPLEPQSFALPAGVDWSIIRENAPGLTRARLAGISRARGDLIVFVDDDNLLSPDYLELAWRLAHELPELLCFGGRIAAEFAEAPPAWVAECSRLLAIRDLGAHPLATSWQSGNRAYPECAPIGAGMVLRRAAAETYRDECFHQNRKYLPDRTGSSLGSAGDNDIVLSVLAGGGAVGYRPELRLTHLISPERCTVEYLCRLNRASSRSWVWVLAKYEILPWKPLSPLKGLRSVFRAMRHRRPWGGALERIRFSGDTGQILGLMSLWDGITRWRSLLAPLRPGRVLYLLYYVPKARIRRLRSRGLRRAHEVSRARRLLKANLALLDPRTFERPYSSNSLHPIHILTGSAFWHQTALCCLTLQQHSNDPLHFYLYDDGSLSRRAADCFHRLLPSSTIVSQAEIEERLERSLPVSRYPTLRAHRLVYPHLRKITDIHAGSRGPRLVLDSDLLFFDYPEFLFEWLNSPSLPCCLEDVTSSYGYPLAFLELLTGSVIPERINVGVCGLIGARIDWDELERWCAALLAVEGPHYSLEQALVAMMCSRQGFLRAEKARYVVLPREQEVRQPKAVLHHYVAEAREAYYRFGWRVAVERLEASQSAARTGTEHAWQG